MKKAKRIINRAQKNISYFEPHSKKNEIHAILQGVKTRSAPKETLIRPSKMHFFKCLNKIEGTLILKLALVN